MYIEKRENSIQKEREGVLTNRFPVKFIRKEREREEEKISKFLALI